MAQCWAFVGMVPDFQRQACNWILICLHKLLIKTLIVLQHVSPFGCKYGQLKIILALCLLSNHESNVFVPICL